MTSIHIAKKIWDILISLALPGISVDMNQSW